MFKSKASKFLQIPGSVLECRLIDSTFCAGLHWQHKFHSMDKIKFESLKIQKRLVQDVMPYGIEVSVVSNYKKDHRAFYAEQKAHIAFGQVNPYSVHDVVKFDYNLDTPGGMYQFMQNTDTIIETLTELRNHIKKCIDESQTS